MFCWETLIVGIVKGNYWVNSTAVHIIFEVWHPFPSMLPLSLYWLLFQRLQKKWVWYKSQGICNTANMSNLHESSDWKKVRMFLVYKDHILKLLSMRLHHQIYWGFRKKNHSEFRYYYSDVHQMSFSTIGCLVKKDKNKQKTQLWI